jgi:hypothetical protein
MSGSEQPKLIIDTDWKSQAQAEKEKLTQPKPGAQGPAGGTDAGTGEEPRERIEFRDIVSMFATQAVMYMGGIADPQTGRAVLAPEYAKLYIDMLAMLQEKTKGNLTPEEDRIISSAVQELRLDFVELSKHVEKMVKEGKIKPAAPRVGGPAAPGASPLAP